MPTYEYKCKKCDITETVQHSMMETIALCCNQCGGDMRKSFALAAVTFKGEGFHSTDKK